MERNKLQVYELLGDGLGDEHFHRFHIGNFRMCAFFQNQMLYREWWHDMNALRCVAKRAARYTEDNPPNFQPLLYWKRLVNACIRKYGSLWIPTDIRCSMNEALSVLDEPTISWTPCRCVLREPAGEDCADPQNSPKSLVTCQQQLHCWIGEVPGTICQLASTGSVQTECGFNVTLEGWHGQKMFVVFQDKVSFDMWYEPVAHLVAYLHIRPLFADDSGRNKQDLDWCQSVKKMATEWGKMYIPVDIRKEYDLLVEIGVTSDVLLWPIYEMVLLDARLVKIHCRRAHSPLPVHVQH